MQIKVATLVLRNGLDRTRFCSHAGEQEFRPPSGILSDRGNRPVRKADGLTGSESNFSPTGGTVTVSQPADYVSDYGPGPRVQGRGGATLWKGWRILHPLSVSGQGRPEHRQQRIHHELQPAQKEESGGHHEEFRSLAAPGPHHPAREFALCDRWFSSLPGPAWSCCGTSRTRRKAKGTGRLRGSWATRIITR